jgi:protein TonB
MTEGGFYQTRGTNPKAVAVVVLLHGAALTALIMAKGEVIERIIHRPIEVYPVPLPPPPPPHPVPPTPQPRTAQSQLDTPKPIVTFPPTGPLTPPSTIDPPPLPPGPVFAKVDRIPVPPPPALTIEPARARADLHSYVSNADYPDAAIRNEEQGTTRFRLLVGANGKVVDCAVTGSSGSSALDSATCRLMKTRARFTPAHDSSGNPTTDNVASAIRWVLPDG